MSASEPGRIRRLLVANRGEIAVRVLRTCRRLGIEGVLTVTEADARSLPARLADRVVRVPSYLDVDAVVAAARTCDALHPGYGFLSENPALATACDAAGVRFVGPSAGTLAAAGDKLAARGHAVAAGVPVLPGGPADSARAVAAEIGFPLLVKAVGGGGGRGMRRVADSASLDAAVDEARAEAGAAFADRRLYLERLVDAGRHVEVQLLGDGERVVHLGDRDCSVQRRFQKLLEEAPAPHLDARLRADMHAAAVALGEHLGYRGAGTVEFLVHAGGFAFLEINARLQVEHPVTEAVTGLDLVAEQIAIAEGQPLRISQDEVSVTGHAIECRLNAEDPDRGFAPSPGTVTDAAFPAGQGIRVDTHVQTGTAVTADYDSLLAKLIVHGTDRAQALCVLRDALARTTIDGIATTIGLHAAIVADPDFATGGMPTGWLPHIISAEPARA
jgi:acetyl-CoA carboxylase, biotin carboxylase subunit